LAQPEPEEFEDAQVCVLLQHTDPPHPPPDDPQEEALLGGTQQ